MNLMVIFTIMSLLISCGGSDNIINTSSGPSSQPIVSCSDDKPASTECLVPKTGTEYHSGTGTLLDPYILCEADEVQAVKDNPASVFKVGSDIDLSSIANFIPIGGCSGDYTCGNGADDPFTGSFDGDGYCISNLTIDTDKNRVGFFGNVETNAVITNIKFEDASVKVEKSGSALRSVGGVVGSASDGTASYNLSISNIDFHGEVKASQVGVFAVSRIGGLVGYGSYSKISNLYFKKESVLDSSVGVGGTSIGHVGGVFGSGFYTQILGEVKSQGAILTKNEGGSTIVIGGITGYNYTHVASTRYLMGSYASISINQVGGGLSYQVGGLVGYSLSRNISQSYSKGNISISSDGTVRDVALGSNFGVSISDSYITGGQININTSGPVSGVGFMSGGVTGLFNRNFVANSSMIINGTPTRIGSFLGQAGVSDIRDSFVLNSPIPTYSGADSGSFVGSISVAGNLTNNFISGDITETGTLNGNTAPGSIVASDVLGNDTHPVFTNWDFATVWEVVPGGLPKLRD